MLDPSALINGQNLILYGVVLVIMQQLKLVLPEWKYRVPVLHLLPIFLGAFMGLFSDQPTLASKIMIGIIIGGAASKGYDVVAGVKQVKVEEKKRASMDPGQRTSLPPQGDQSYGTLQSNQEAQVTTTLPSRPAIPPDRPTVPSEARTVSLPPKPRR